MYGLEFVHKCAIECSHLKIKPGYHKFTFKVCNQNAIEVPCVVLAML